ncbi:MAG: hypothetical protein WCE52_04080 [Candidatus Acidiferrum sp.]
MLVSSIGWILILSGAATAAGGLAACLFPHPVLKVVFGAKSTDGLTLFFVRHWGALLCVVCALTVYSAYFPATRVPILTASVIEKFVIVALIFFGPLKRTFAMTAIGIMDGILALLFVAYLAAL